MSVKILLALPLFAPSKIHFDRQMRSIQALAEYINADPIVIEMLDIVYSGWVPNKEYRDLISGFLQNSLPSAKIFFLDKNYGKSVIVNKIVFDYYESNPECQSFITWDSDMIMMMDQPHFFQRLAIYPDAIQKQTGKAFGFVGINQAGEGCHWLDTMKEGMKYNVAPFNIDEEAIWPSNASGIAGGGLLINIKGFVSVKGYRPQINPYGSDDGFCGVDFYQLGYHIGVLKTLFIEHPPTPANHKYIAWKSTVIKDFDKPFDIDVYNANVESSMKFWLDNPEG